MQNRNWHEELEEAKRNKTTKKDRQKRDGRAGMMFALAMVAIFSGPVGWFGGIILFIIAIYLKRSYAWYIIPLVIIALLAIFSFVLSVL